MTAAVAAITSNREPNLGSVTTNLVGTSSQEPRTEVSGSVAKAPTNLEVRRRLPTRHRPLHGRDFVGPRTGHNHIVAPLDIMNPEELGQLAVGQIGLREHQNSTCRQVESVNDEDVVSPLPREQVGKVAAIAFWSRSRQEAGRLLDDDQIIVLMKNLEVGQLTLVALSRLAPNLARGPLESSANRHFNGLTLSQSPGCDLHTPAINEHRT